MPAYDDNNQGWRLLITITGMIILLAVLMTVILVGGVSLFH